MAIGVARRGAHRGGERTLRIPPSCSLPVSHAFGPHVASFVRRFVGVRASERIFVSLFAGGRGARRSAKASRKKERPAQREAKRKKEWPAKKRVGTLKKKKKGAVRTARFAGSGNGEEGSA